KKPQTTKEPMTVVATVFEKDLILVDTVFEIVTGSLDFALSSLADLVVIPAFFGVRLLPSVLKDEFHFFLQSLAAGFRGSDLIGTDSLVVLPDGTTDRSSLSFTRFNRLGTKTAAYQLQQIQVQR